MYVVKKWSSRKTSTQRIFVSERGLEKKKKKEEGVMKRLAVWCESMNAGCSRGADGYHDNERDSRGRMEEVWLDQFITTHSCVCVCV